MSATKWRVRKDRWPDGDEYGGWFVFPPGRGWGELWHSDIALFDGHPEALAYADRMARTVEVTLPRVNKATLLGVSMDFPFMGGVSMSNGEAESLGLTLLALARRKEQK